MLHIFFFELSHLDSYICLFSFQVSSGMTKGGVVAIVTVLFLLVLLAVDASCCYRNQRGLLMYIAVKVFGQRVPEQLMLRSVETHTSGCTT